MPDLSWGELKPDALTRLLPCNQATFFGIDKPRKNMHFCQMLLGSTIRFTPPTRKVALQVNGMGWKERMLACFINRPSGTGDYLLMGFHGPAEFQDTTGLRRFDGPSYILWGPGDSHYYGWKDGPFVHSWLHAEGATMAEIVRHTPLKSGVGHCVDDLSPLEQMLQELHKEMTEWVSPSPDIASAVIDLGLRRLARLASKGPFPNLPPKNLRDAKLRVDSDPASILSVAGMAREAGLSRQHFTELFRHHFGMAPMKYVLQARMHRAAYLLRDQNLRVADVAWAVGFKDSFHFSRSFRKEFGIPPRLFKMRQMAGASSVEATR
jgi:AraC family transcriptional regulator of arabinose operon